MAANSPSTIVGENIELGNRLLAQHSSTNSRRIDGISLSQAYTHLGVLMHHNMAMSDDLTEAMNVMKGSRRYEYKPHDPRVKKAEVYLQTVVDDMKKGTWQHYPFPPAKKKRGRPKRSIVEREMAEEKALEDELDQDYDDKDDADAVLEESIEEGVKRKKKSKQKRSHQADTWRVMQSKMTLDQVASIRNEPWLERLKKWSKSLWKLEDRWQLKLPADFAEELEAKAPFFAQ